MPGPLTSTTTAPSPTPVPAVTTTISSSALTTKNVRQLQSVRGFGAIAFRSLNRIAGRWNPYPFKFTAAMAPPSSNGTKGKGASSATASKPKPIGFLQLPVLDTLAPLTEGTNLPPVLLDPSPPSSSHSNKDALTTATPVEPTAAEKTLASPPLSPTSPNRPGSVRRFLSRVSLNSSYNAPEGKESDAASVMSKPPMSPTASMHSNIHRSASKKGSWWRRSKSGSAEAPKPLPVRSITPPPTLPEVKGTQAAFEDDIFKGL